MKKNGIAEKGVFCWCSEFREMTRTFLLLFKTSLCLEPMS